ncbi:MAG: MinD/ParA family protein [Planctomycetaceae bacterium]|nr:MinD/ParA family protein [Planctomycetaceae bacterium]
MAQIISVHSFRGGTGKSNTTANLATLIAKRGARVGVIDTDIQSPGVHVIFGRSPSSFAHSLNDYLWGRCRIADAACDVTEAAIGNVIPDDPRRVFLIPSSLNAGEIARVLREGYDVAKLNDGINELVDALKLDYLLIDTHPGVNEETLLSIAISDCFLLVLRPDNQDFQGTAVTVELARRLNVERILVMLNKVPESLDRAALKEQVEGGYGAPLIGILPLNDEMAELASSGIFVNRFPQHPFSREITAIANRLVEM